MTFSKIDIFCHVVDNFGDIGVVYRFARALKASFPDVTLRVFVDDLATFKVICSPIDLDKTVQEHESIIWIDSSLLDEPLVTQLGTAELVFETFACEIPPVYMKHAYYESTLLINLEHLSAEEWIEGYHCKESLLPEGTLRKFYFMPGFTENTGGLIPNITSPIAISSSQDRIETIRSLIPDSIHTYINNPGSTILGSVFTYVRNLDNLINDCSMLSGSVTLLAFGEKTIRSFRKSLQSRGSVNKSGQVHTLKNCTIIEMPFIPQQNYDQLLQLMDFNIVRGEDSLTRAVLSGKPFIWNAYLQDNCYQVVKVKALCSTMQRWIVDSEDFEEYQRLMIAFNSAPSESDTYQTSESFQYFLNNLKKYEHSINEMSYFMTRNCNLLKKIATFIRDYPNI
ncbi:MAG TPA: elongation factor P maturation arginine rhamnosyltransferase EarP [Chitinispirillaceae bacterium]|nr:elongation factor P maturation arginine rhamnosyltransferase EarP [Chitinispirillaceae bacterium]